MAQVRWEADGPLQLKKGRTAQSRQKYAMRITLSTARKAIVLENMQQNQRSKNVVL